MRQELEELDMVHFGSKYLVKAINNCSCDTQEEVSQELKKLAEKMESS